MANMRFSETPKVIRLPARRFNDDRVAVKVRRRYDARGFELTDSRPVFNRYGFTTVFELLNWRPKRGLYALEFTPDPHRGVIALWPEYATSGDTSYNRATLNCKIITQSAVGAKQHIFMWPCTGGIQDLRALGFQNMTWYTITQLYKVYE